MLVRSAGALGIALLMLSAVPAAAEDEEPNIEFFYPVVTRRPVIERELELGVHHEKRRDGRETEAAAAIELPLLPRWQLEVEVPLVFTDPRAGASAGGFGDLSVENKVLLWKSVEHRALVAGGFELTLPSGSERRGLGGTAAVEPFLTAGIALGPLDLLGLGMLTMLHLAVDLVRELIATVPNLRGMKYTGYDMYMLRKIIELDEGRFNVLSGADEVMVSAQAMGADGAIGTTENLLPRVFVDAYTAFGSGNVRAAEELQAKINWTVNAFLSFPSLGAVKEIMRLLGFDLGNPRLPLLGLTDTQRGRLREMLEEISFFKWAV